MNPEAETDNADPPGATRGEQPPRFNGLNSPHSVLGPFRVPLPYIWLRYPPEQLHLHYSNMFQLPRALQVQPETAAESSRLYKLHLQRETERGGVTVPPLLLLGTKPPNNMKTLITLAEHFRGSPQRRWVFEHARTVDLESLSFRSFRALLNGLFNEGGITWERVLVLFFFCSDLSIRALYEHFGTYFQRVYDWSLCYMHLVLSFWIQQHGGWEMVLAHTVRNNCYRTGLVAATLSCLGAIALFAFIRNK